MGFITKVTINLPKADEFIKRLGLDPQGDLQRFHTANIRERMRKYMPYLSGELQGSLTTIQTDIDSSEIVTQSPGARFLFNGMLMLDDETGSAWSPLGGTKHVTDTPLNYTKQFNPQAGPRWDKAVVANEGDAIVQDLQNEIDRRAK